MENEQLIPADEFCLHFGVEPTFVLLLSEAQLIDVVQMEERYFVHTSQLYELEKYARLHYDLDINIEGLETIKHLLETITDLQKQNAALRARLKFFE